MNATNSPLTGIGGRAARLADRSSRPGATVTSRSGTRSQSRTANLTRYRRDQRWSRRATRDPEHGRSESALSYARVSGAAPVSRLSRPVRAGPADRRASPAAGTCLPGRTAGRRGPVIPPAAARADVGGRRYSGLRICWVVIWYPRLPYRDRAAVFRPCTLRPGDVMPRARASCPASSMAALP
jgi:hypothetical protein